MYLYFCFNSFLFKLNFLFIPNTMQAMFKQKHSNFCQNFIITLIQNLLLNKNGRLKIDF